MAEPPLVFQYRKYCHCVDDFAKNGSIDLRRETFFAPAFALPLALLILKNSKAPRFYPENPSSRSYLATIIGMKIENRRTNSYVPLEWLPHNEADATAVLQNIYDVQKNYAHSFDGEMAFKYVVNELVDNIYQHSKFKLASVMAQRNPNLGYVEHLPWRQGHGEVQAREEPSHERNPDQHESPIPVASR